MVKDICWEVSETVIPDLPAWLNITLKSQVTGHRAGMWGSRALSKAGKNAAGKRCPLLFLLTNSGKGSLTNCGGSFSVVFLIKDTGLRDLTCWELDTFYLFRLRVGISALPLLCGPLLFYS